MQARTLEQWLAWMEAHHPRQIDLGLGRVAAVAANLTLDFSGAPVISVGGTNGKGSCVAFLAAILRAQGYRVGCYTSPHLLRYNERVAIDGAPVSDAQLCDAFSAVEHALHGISLTYFEFGTLAALWLFQRAALDVIVLEVGLGGRLDAVNLIAADVAVLTTIDIDHQDWLGFDRESIGREKAGIFRAQRAAICADPTPPHSVSDYAQQIGAHWYPVGEAFAFAAQENGWSWSSHSLPRKAHYDALPLPSLPLPSAAAAMAALHCLPLPITEAAIRQGLSAATLPGRFQQMQWRGVDIIFDVAHNPQAARWLTARLRQLPHRYTRAVLAVMADKDIDAIIDAVKPQIDAWFVGDLIGNARALDATALGATLRAHTVSATITESIEQAFMAAVQAAAVGERIVVFGSFFTVAAVLLQLQNESSRSDDSNKRNESSGKNCRDNDDSDSGDSNNSNGSDKKIKGIDNGG